MYQLRDSLQQLGELPPRLSGHAAVFNVFYWGIDERLPSNPVHRHSFFEVCYVMGGEGEYTEGGVDYPLRTGTHICSRPGIVHQIRTRDNLFLLYTSFELDESRSTREVAEAFRLLTEKGTVWVPHAEQSPTALLWRSLLLPEGTGRGSLSAVAAESSAYALLLSFPAQFGYVGQRAAPQRGSTVIFQRAKHYIRDNLAGDLSLSEVAQYLNVSERHLSRLFSAGIGENFTRFVQQERIRQAALLLQSSPLTVQEIAESTGFSSVHYFSRVFNQEKQMPPARYRRLFNQSE